MSTTISRGDRAPIGGFFELEVGAPHASFPHGEATALTSGRACLRLALEVLRPRRAWLPFYVCDAAVAPFRSLGIEIRFYELAPGLDPADVQPLADDECLLFVNYFGLKNETARSLAASLGPRVIVDDSQAYFQQGYQGAWSFNSARKFFGVPDGAFLYAPARETWEREPNSDIHYDHLIRRWLAHDTEAFAAYQESERHVASDVRGPSALSRALLRAIDHDRMRTERRAHFAQLHARLAPWNMLAQTVPLTPDAVPFCYPLLPSKCVPRERLWADRLFVPTLWPEIAGRAETGFGWSRDLAARLLPLPVDHRSSDAEMDRLAVAVLELVT